MSSKMRYFIIGGVSLGVVLMVLLAGVVMDIRHAWARKAADVAYQQSIHPAVAVAPARKRSAKSIQMIDMAYISESDCVRNDRAIASPYHEKNAAEDYTALRCYTRKERIKDPGAFDLILDKWDQEEAAKR